MPRNLVKTLGGICEVVSTKDWLSEKNCDLKLNII